MSKIISYPKESATCRKLDTSVALFVVWDFQPLSMVENEGFRQLVHDLNPRYSIISRKRLTKDLLPQLFETSMNKLMLLLEKAVSISVTTDSWTSTANQSYLGITCHFFLVDNKDVTLHSAALDLLLIENDETAETLTAMLRNCFEK